MNGKMAAWTQKAGVCFLTLSILLCLTCVTAPAKTITIAVPVEPGSLDPHRGQEPASWAFTYPCYQRLTSFKPDSSQIEPSLALTWRISGDGRLYTFVLKKGQTFSDGRTVNAKAVCFSFRRVMGLGLAGSVYFPFLRDVEVLGPYTVRFTLSRPFAPFLVSLAANAASIVSPGLSGLPRGYLDRQTLGSGLYRVSSWEPGRKIALKARPGLRSRPKIEAFTAVFEPDSAKRLDMLRRGQVQIAEELGPAEYAALQADPALKQFSAPAFSCEYITVNCRRPWLTQVRARRALALAIDYDGLLESLPAGSAERLGGPLPRGVWSRRTDLKGYEHDPEKAAQILKETGRPKQSLVLAYTLERPWRSLTAARIKKDLEKLGLKVKPLKLEGKEFDRVLEKGEFDLAICSWRPNIADPYVFLSHWLFSPVKGNQQIFYQNRESVRLLEKAMALIDRKQRPALYGRIQEALVSDSPYLFLFQINQRFGLSKQVKGFSGHPALEHVYPLNKLDLAPAIPPLSESFPGPIPPFF
ncbi:MAG: ABC transporter substrate-binding protein [Thermodesulfobacteriota bacterium]|nr:ABC transporter substrate-binding protein [Thermodesulfobacteriota bacterium]